MVTLAGIQTVILLTIFELSTNRSIIQEANGPMFQNIVHLPFKFYKYLA